MTPAEILKAMVEAAQRMPPTILKEHYKVTFITQINSTRNAYRLERFMPDEGAAVISYKFTLPPYNDELILWSPDLDFSEAEAMAIAAAVVTQGSRP